MNQDESHYTARHNKSEPVVPDKRSLAYPSRTLDPPVSLVDRALEIQKAGEAIETSVNGKLNLILNQIRSLQEEARRILEQARRDSFLHTVKCSFEKKTGQMIYLYYKGSAPLSADDEESWFGAEPDTLYFSILSPSDWVNPPHRYLGCFIPGNDGSFTRCG